MAPEGRTRQSAEDHLSIATTIPCLSPKFLLLQFYLPKAGLLLQFSAGTMECWGVSMDNGHVVPAGKGMAMKAQRWYNFGGRRMAQDDCEAAARAPEVEPVGKAAKGLGCTLHPSPRSPFPTIPPSPAIPFPPTVLCVQPQFSVLFRSSCSPASPQRTVLRSAVVLCSLPECSGGSASRPGFSVLFRDGVSRTVLCGSSVRGMATMLPW